MRAQESKKRGPNLFYDKNIVRKTFEPHQKVLLYSSHLHIFPGKLCSRWTGPFIVKVVHPYGVVEIENPENGKLFKVNGQRLKPFLENFDPRRVMRNWQTHSARMFLQRNLYLTLLYIAFLFLFMHFFTFYSFCSVFVFFIKESLSLCHIPSYLPMETSVFFFPFLYFVVCFFQCIEGNTYFRGGGGHTLVFRAI